MRFYANWIIRQPRYRNVCADQHNKQVSRKGKCGGWAKQTRCSVRGMALNSNSKVEKHYLLSENITYNEQNKKSNGEINWECIILRYENKLLRTITSTIFGNNVCAKSRVMSIGLPWFGSIFFSILQWHSLISTFYYSYQIRSLPTKIKHFDSLVTPSPKLIFFFAIKWLACSSLSPMDCTLGSFGLWIYSQIIPNCLPLN